MKSLPKAEFNLGTNNSRDFGVILVQPFPQSHKYINLRQSHFEHIEGI